MNNMLRPRRRSLRTALVLTLALAPLCAQGDWFRCEANQVLETQNRVHVRCANSQRIGRNNIRFIAIDKGDPSRTQRFIEMGISAMCCGHVFEVDIPSSPSSNASGCRDDDCRTPVSFGVARR